MEEDIQRACQESFKWVFKVALKGLSFSKALKGISFRKTLK